MSVCIEERTNFLPLTDERHCDVTETFGAIFLVPSSKRAEEDEESAAMRKSMEKLNKVDSNICREHIPPSVISEDQVAQVLLAIPSDYWTLQCWTCRQAGHSAFTCPCLTLAQRIFFAYCYYRYLVAANPRIAHWFQEREAFRKGQGTEPGPKPRLPSASVRGGRGGGVSGRGRGGYSRHAGREGLQTFVIPQVLQR